MLGNMVIERNNNCLMLKTMTQYHLSPSKTLNDITYPISWYCISKNRWACGTVNTSTTISTIIFIWWLETSVTCISSRILSSKEISDYEDVVVAEEKVYTRGGSQSKRCIKKQGQDENKRGLTTSCIWKMKVAVAIGVSNLQVNSVLKLCHLILLVQLVFWKHL